MTTTLIVLLYFWLCRGPWDQVQAVALPKPSIWADPGPMVTNGSRVTIWCQGSLQAEAYLLYKERSYEPMDTKVPQDSNNKASFSIVSMKSHDAGQYQCAYYTAGNISSERSDPLRLVVTGMYGKPSLSAQPGPSVSWGVNVTLQCRSEIWFDTFHLYREGSLDPPQHLCLQDKSAPSQANFTIGPVTSDHEGNYTCYSSHSTSRYLLSHPSDPLELVVSGLKWNLYILIGVSVALVLLLSLLLLLLLRHQRQSKGRTSDAAVKDPQPGESVERDPQNRHDDDPHGGTYAQVNHSRSRLRQGVATSPSSLSWGLLDRKGRQAEEDSLMHSQAAAPDTTQDVTYAQLNHLTLSQKTTVPPFSPSEESSDEPSVYVSLATH